MVLAVMALSMMEGHNGAVSEVQLVIVLAGRLTAEGLYKERSYSCLNSESGLLVVLVVLLTVEGESARMALTFAVVVVIMMLTAAVVVSDFDPPFPQRRLSAPAMTPLFPYPLSPRPPPSFPSPLPPSSSSPPHSPPSSSLRSPSPSQLNPQTPPYVRPYTFYHPNPSHTPSLPVPAPPDLEAWHVPSPIHPNPRLMHASFSAVVSQHSRSKC